MKHTNIKQIAFIAVTGLFLNACGSSGGSDVAIIPSPPVTTPPPVVTSPPVVEVKVPQCGTAADMGKALASDVTGKTIQKMETGAEVRIWHSPDATKLACMITGEAKIINTLSLD